MVVMWMFMILVWRMLGKVLRRFGRWALVVLVAAMGAAVFGLNIWTAATVLLALLLAVLLALVLVGWRQAGTSGLLPVTMLGAGTCGLWAAASMARSWAAAGFSVWNAFTIRVKIPGGFRPLAPAGRSEERACSIAGGDQAARRNRGAGQVRQLRVAAKARHHRTHRPAGRAAASRHPRPQPLVGTPADSRVAAAAGPRAVARASRGS